MKLVLRLINVTVALIGIALIVISVTYFITITKKRREYIRESQSWGKVALPLNQIPFHFPQVSTNDSALKLDELLLPLGFCLTSTTGCPASKQARMQIEALNKFIHDYVDAQIVDPNDNLELPPQEIIVYLTTHDSDLKKISDHLIIGPQPVWGYDVGMNVSVPLPNLLGAMFLQRLFLVQSIIEVKDGHQAQAELTMEASFRLNDAIKERPEAVSYMVWIGMLREQIGIVRKLPSYSPAIQKYIMDVEFRKRLSVANEFDFWSLDQAYQHCNVDGNNPDGAKWPKHPPIYCREIIALPVRVEMSIYSRTTLARLQKLDPCQLSHEADNLPKPERWDVIGRVATVGMPNLVSFWRRLGRIELEMEMTRIVMEARHPSMAFINSEPTNLPTQPQSSICTGAHWGRKFDVSGSITLSFSATPDWNDMRGASIPLIYTITPENH